MGRRNRRRERNGGEEQKASGSATDARKADQPRATRPEHYEEILRENEAFVLYYKAQKVIPEEEWDLFMRTLATNLPVSFRITGFRSEAALLRSIIKTKYFQGLKRIPRAGDEEEVEVVPTALPWYPEELAWQVNLTRQMIRRNEELAKFHHFLVSETICGAISRQEAVSMIPPVVMDVKPHHKVLDMCAAPGSKTTQLLEMLHADESKMPEGLVVANDADNKRCYMLVTQSKRLNSPNLIIINHDASNLPSMTETSADGVQVPLKFDRVLCDVPCSGDGTMRKNVDVWKKWNGANGNNLHWLQFRIARRGLELLKTDGLMVYSTCSLNPVEDEAVLCRLMREYPGCIELVDVSDRVPGLKYSPGVTDWKPMSRDMNFYDKAEDVPEKFASQIRAPMFPPTEEEAKQFHLERCMRILPHHQDTGGFFVAAIRKLGPLKKANPEGSNGSTNGEKKGAAENGGTTETAVGGKEDSAEDEEKMQPPKKRRFFGYREDPFLYFNEDEPTWGPIRDFFGLEGIDPTILLSRNRVGKKKNVYLTSASVKDFIVNNEDKVKVINTGIKAFIRTDGKNSDCEFRLAQEGASEMLRFVKKRIVNLKQEDALAILRKHDLEDPLQNSQLCTETQEQLKDINTGSIIFLHETEIPETKKKLTLVMVGWKGATTIRAYVAKSDRVHLLRLCGGDTTYFENLDIEAKFRNKGAGDGDDADAKTSEGAENDKEQPSTEEASGDAMESSESKKESVENSAV